MFEFPCIKLNFHYRDVDGLKFSNLDSITNKSAKSSKTHGSFTVAANTRAPASATVGIERSRTEENSRSTNVCPYIN